MGAHDPRVEGEHCSGRCLNLTVAIDDSRQLIAGCRRYGGRLAFEVDGATVGGWARVRRCDTCRREHA